MKKKVLRERRKENEEVKKEETPIVTKTLRTSKTQRKSRVSKKEE